MEPIGAAQPDVAVSREAPWRWWAGILVSALTGTDLFRWLGEVLKQQTEPLGTALVAVAQSLKPAAWPAASAFALYWALDRRLRRAAPSPPVMRFEGHFDPGPPRDEINWSIPSHIFYAEMILPTLRASTDGKLTAEFRIGTHQRVPEGTRVVKWSVKFNVNGQVLPEWVYERHDVQLQSVATTKLYPTPEVLVGSAVTGMSLAELKAQQLPVSCEVFALVRVPELTHDVKFNEALSPQVCRIQ